MIAWLRVVPRAVPFPACAGVVIGFWNASREISANRYLPQGLWRTALWLSSHDALVGALIGLATGVLLAFSLTRKQPAGASGALILERRLALAVVLTAALAVTFVFLAPAGPGLLGYPARGVFGLGLGLFWAVTVTLLLIHTSEETSPADAVDGVWTITLWLGYLVALSHLWARLDPGVPMAVLASAGLLGVVLAYAVLGRPVQFLVQLVGGRVRRPVALRRLHRLSLGVLGVGALLWISAGAVAQQARGDLRQAHPNLLIIAVDTLREDRVSVISKPTSGWDLTPNLRERLAPHGTYFTRAYSQAPWTMPSFASIFTGRYPEEHGAQFSEARLLPHQLTLAEILRDQGYRTMAVVSGHFVSSNVGMLQGFEITDESQVQKLNPEAVTSPEVTRRALGLLAPRRDQPFFMFVHYFDPHYEYKTHPEFHFADPKGGLSLPRRLNVLRHPQTEVSPQDLAQLKARYAEEIAFTDQHLGRLLAYLDEHHLWDSTCVVFVADHGDEFLEHGSFEHGHTVFEELVHVPLFVSDPSRRAAAVAEQVVETRWLFGTVLDMLGVRRSASQGTTHNVFSAPQDREYYARSSIYGHQSCLIGDQYKVIDGPSKRMQTLPTARSGPAGSVRTIRQTGTESSNKLMLFDLLQDPGESRDLSRDLPEVSHRLRSTLAKLNEELSRRGEKVTMPRLTEQQRRVLKNLGYL